MAQPQPAPLPTAMAFPNMGVGIANYELDLAPTYARDLNALIEATHQQLFGIVSGLCTLPWIPAQIATMLRAGINLRLGQEGRISTLIAVEAIIRALPRQDRND